MSEDSKIVRKRGRPKKTAEVDTIILIDSSVSTEPAIGKTKGAKTKAGRTVAESSDLAATPKKRVPRASVVKDRAEEKITKATKATRAKTSAKNTDNVIAPSGMESTVGVSIPTLTTSTSEILEHATAFQNVVTKPLLVESQSQDSPSESASSDKDIRNSYTVQETIPVKRIDRQSLIDLQVHSDGLTRDLRSLEFERIDLFLSQASRFLQQSSTSITKEEAKLAEAPSSTSQLNRLPTAIDSLEDGIQVAPTETQQLPHTVDQDQQVSEHPHVEKQPQAFEANLTDRDPKHLPSTLIFPAHRLEELDVQTGVLTAEIQQSSTILNSLIAPHSTDLPTTSSPTSPILSTSTMGSQPNQPTLRSQPPAPSSSIKPQPFRLQRISQHQPQPRPLRPTEQPYEVLRKTPAFKRQSRQWTGIIVGIPVIIATSWVLFKRYQDTLTKRMKELSPEGQRGRERGTLPATETE